MDRRALLLALLLVLSGCETAPTPATGTPTTSGPSEPSTESTPEAPTATTVTTGGTSTDRSVTATTANGTSERLGWEAGYRYDAELPVNASDGLNDTELDAVVARTMARVEHLRGLEFRRSVPVETISREAYRDRYGEAGNVSPDRRAVDNALFEALFLVGEDEDSIGEKRGLLGEAVQGVYFPASDRIVLVTRNGTPRVSEAVLAHELLHALQHSRYDLRGRGSPTMDRRMAIDALVEGDARYLDRLYGARCRTEWDCVEGASGGGDRDLHYGLYYLLSFPYSDGSAFVRRTRNAGGWDAVNALYDDPPESAEQVIDPGAHRNDSPRNVSLPDRSARRWSPVDAPDRPRTETVGQAGIAAMFAHPILDGRPGVVVPADRLSNDDAERGDDRLDALDPYHYDFAYPDGWDGDAFRVYENRTGATAYAWRIVWDSPAEAREFADGYRELLEYWGGERVEGDVWRIPENESGFADAFRLRVDGDAVTVVNAPTVDQLSAVHAPARDGNE